MVHYAMVFHPDQDSTPESSLMRSRVWTDPGIEPGQTKAKEVKRRSKEKAEEVLDVAKYVEGGDQDEIKDEATGGGQLVGMMA